MKKTKVLLMVLCMVLVAMTSVLGTLAYLTAQDTVVNTFTVGQVSIKLDEAKVDADGVPDQSGERVKENAYHLLPGKTYTKDPTVTVLKGSEESYIRMLVTLTNYKELKEVFGDDFLPQNFVEGWDSAVWLTTNVIAADDAANTATYEFRYKATVKPTSTEDTVLEPLFTKIVMPGDLTGEDLAKIAGMKITVIGHAIQASGFATADEAWGEFTE